jgi:predicted nucleotidyltransferase component of viral defense system
LGKKNYMANLILDQFERILKFGREYNLPFFKKESILREFLQAKILEKIYQQKISKNIYFVGETSLRLLYHLNRFSEDLDFDFDQSVNQKEIIALYKKVVFLLRKENIEVEEYINQTKKRLYFELRFPGVLYPLGFSSSKDQKLVIKLDFENYWQGLTPEIVVLERYGILAKIVTLSLDKILVQKLFAYLNRKETLGRDLYDILWVVRNGAKIDWDFVKKNNLSSTPSLVEKVKMKFSREKKRLILFKNQVKILLIDPLDVNIFDFFEDFFPERENLKYLRMDEEEAFDFDGYLFTFYFQINKKKLVKFVVKMTGTRRVKENKEKIEAVFKEKIFDFFLKNPVRNYQTRLINTKDLDIKRINLEKILE